LTGPLTKRTHEEKRPWRSSRVSRRSVASAGSSAGTAGWWSFAQIRGTSSARA